ncbi:hypothetical protein Tco_0851302 [Tanacetum coccineum]
MGCLLRSALFLVTDDDEESNHEDASDTGAAPKQKQQVIPQTTAISNIKLPILKKEEYDIWAMEMEHYLEYIDNDAWKERKAKNILLMAIPKEHMRRFHGMDDAKEIWEAIRTRKFKAALKNIFKCLKYTFVSQRKSSTNKVKSGFTSAYSTCTPSTSSTNIPEKEVLAGFADEVIYSLFAKQSEDWDLLHEDLEQINDLDIEEIDINWQIVMIAIRIKKFYKKTGRRVRGMYSKGGLILGLWTMDDGIVNWGEHTEDEETNHALMAISSSSEDSGIDLGYLELSALREGIYWNLPTENSVYDPEFEISSVPPDKMAREAEFKKQRVFNIGNRVAKPVWTNENRVNHANQFVPKPVQLNAGRPKINSVMPNINTGRTNINFVRPNVNTGRVNVNPVRPRVNTSSSNVNTVRFRQPVPTKTSNYFSPKRL